MIILRNILLISAFFIGCSSQQDEQKSLVKIAISGTKDPTKLKSPNASRAWGITPTANADFDCIGIFVTYLNRADGRGNCQNTVSATVSAPHVVSLAVAPGSPLAIELDPDSNVRIQVFGIDTAEVCPNVRNIMNFTQSLFSAPYLISDDVFNLQPGDQTLSIATTFGTVFANTCTGGPFITSVAALWGSNNWDAGLWGP